MNWEHLKAILRLRWQLSFNQARRLGIFNFVFMYVITVSAVITAIGSFFAAWTAGVMILPKASPWQVLIAWDILVAVFTFYWITMLLTEIQRNELLALDKLLHLPMSLSNVFLLNYVSSLFSLGLFIFLSAASGFAIAMAWVYGWRMMLLPPLVFSFLLMVTGVTYHVRGWLAMLMVNPRRRRSLLIGVTIAIIGLAQVPNVAIQLTLRHTRIDRQRIQKEAEKKRTDLAAELEGNSDENAIAEKKAALEVELAELAKQSQAASFDQWKNWLLFANQVIPVLWLPMAAHELIHGSLRWGWLCMLGMSMLGAISLWCSYHATLRSVWRIEKGKSTAKPKLISGQLALSSWMNSKLPWVNDQTSAAFYGNILGLMRAPEAKMALIVPICIAGALGVLYVANPIRVVNIWLGAGALQMLLLMLSFGMMVVASNTFGLDRDGFRAYILMPISRRDLLLAKNLSLIPPLLVLVVVGTAMLLAVLPIELAHLFASLFQLTVLFCCTSLIGNLTSIYFPIRMNTGTGKPQQMGVLAAMVHSAAVFSPLICLLPGTLVLMLEYASRTWLGWPKLPIYLIVSVLQSMLAIAIYHRLLAREGRMLQQREPLIMQALASTSE